MGQDGLGEWPRDGAGVKLCMLYSTLFDRQHVDLIRCLSLETWAMLHHPTSHQYAQACRNFWIISQFLLNQQQPLLLRTTALTLMPTIKRQDLKGSLRWCWRRTPPYFNRS